MKMHLKRLLYYVLWHNHIIFHLLACKYIPEIVILYITLYMVHELNDA